MLGARGAQDRFQVVKMRRNLPKLTQKDSKREPTTTKMDPKGPNFIFHFEKGRQKAIEMHPKIDIGKRSAPGRFPHYGVGTPGCLFATFMLKKGGFREPFGIRNLQKSEYKPHRNRYRKSIEKRCENHLKTIENYVIIYAKSKHLPEDWFSENDDYRWTVV